MASNINATDLDVTFPIAGQDNDTQGFRTNFTVIKNNFNVAANEISSLQTSVLSSPTISNAPLSSSSVGYTGNIAFDNNYLYVAVNNNTWTFIPTANGSGLFGTVNTNSIQLTGLSQANIANLTPVNGMMVYNTTYGNVQFYTSRLNRWGNVVLS